jgi:hypothetical protein
MTAALTVLGIIGLLVCADVLLAAYRLAHAPETTLTALQHGLRPGNALTVDGTPCVVYRVIDANVVAVRRIRDPYVLRAWRHLTRRAAR